VLNFSDVDISTMVKFISDLTVNFADTGKGEDPGLTAAPTTGLQRSRRSLS
jgi:hypothetical protein